MPGFKLPETQATFLRTLVVRGDAHWGQLSLDDREAYDPLAALGYVSRVENGTGTVGATKRGVLKCIAEGWVNHHPDDRLSFAEQLAKL